MGKLALKRCPVCGTYHDISVRKCGCGKDLSAVRAVLTDVGIYSQKRGTINEKLPVYYQKCTNCGEMNFTADPRASIGRCVNCAKKRLSPALPVLYEEEEEAAPPEPVNPFAGEIRAEQQMAAILNSVQSIAAQNQDPGPAAADGDERQDDDEAPPDWESLLEDTAETAEAAEPAKPAAGAKPEVPKPKNTTLTMSAVRYGRCTVVLKPSDCATPVMLGRSALKADFLSQDLRVGNDHCEIFYKDGEWYVRDHHSANGTAVNGADIGLDGEAKLSDGDFLKLGHHDDSMEFSVSIRETP